MNFDRKKFFDGFRDWQKSITPQQVNGLNFILDSIELDSHLTRIEEPAYMLGTTFHETAFTMQPIHEYGSKQYFIRNYGGQTPKGRRLGNDSPDEGWIYAGQGDVQLTGESNYERAEDALRKEYPELVAAFEVRTGKHFDLTVGDQPGDIEDAKNAQDPAIAYAIMSFGMRTGMFTGLGFYSKKFSGLTGKALYKAWRKIINGTDHDDEIAAYAVRFEKILRASLIDPDSAVAGFKASAVFGEAGSVLIPNEAPAAASERPAASSEMPAEGTENKSEPPAAPSVEVKAATPSWTASIGSGLAYISGLGISVGTFLQGKLEQITLNHVIVIAVLIGVGYAIHHYSSKRAQERTLRYIENAENPETPNLKVT